MVLMGKMTEGIYNEIKAAAESTPEQFNDTEYLGQLQQQLSEKLSSLTVRKNGNITYTACNLDMAKLMHMLPDYDDGANISDEGIYKGGEFQSLIKQIDFTDQYGNEYSVSIITSLKQVIPQVKFFAVEVMVAIILILITTSLLLNLWIYRSIIKPVDKLKLATQNIKMGNLDFEMPKVSNDEIGDVCRDFEEMRVILKESSDDKLASDQEEKELIRNISHDLKTPLTAIKGYVEGILDGIADTPERREKYLRTIANKVNDMDKLIDELTIYSKLDTNRVPYSFAKINLKDYFDDCCEEIGIDLEAQGIKLEYKYHATQGIIVMADAEQLKRVVNNIVSNSVKYMTGEREGVIRIDIYDERDYAHIVINDNGKGISTSELPRIFERFYRTDASRNSKQGGSGIGLAIVKKIIEDHKGKIWAESVEGEGTTMHINLLKYKDNMHYCLVDKSRKKNG
jgi:signal transduction histidine kinase